MNPIDAPNWNYRWTTLAAMELIRQGVRNFFISPGSRSTPLAWAVADTPGAQCHVHFDERGAAFAALGCARATKTPVVLLCTSGSAVANYFPAVVEADAANVPLLLLTADRPPELLDCGANQAIDQDKIFHNHLRWFFNLPCPAPEVPATLVLTSIAQALRRCTGAFAGPVQLNFQFREPLAPTRINLPPLEEILLDWISQDSPYTTWHTGFTTLNEAQLKTIADNICSTERGLLVVGQLQDCNEADACHALATALGWPVFADITSNIYSTGYCAPNIRYYDALLQCPEYVHACNPDVILHIGASIISKRLNQHLAKQKGRYIQINAHPERHDNNHQVRDRYEADLTTACIQLSHLLHTRKQGSPTTAATWAERWYAADKAIDTFLTQRLENSEPITEPGVLRCVSRQIHADSILFVGNSMPVRDLDLFAALSDDNSSNYRVTANRGASGIDGNIATAWGWALGTKAPVTAILGDLAALHDMNSLALMKASKTPFSLIIINNHGGGIFSFLPVADHTTHFELLFGTPHGLKFNALASMFGLDYYQPKSMKEFSSIYKACQKGTAANLIEVHTNREENVQFHRTVQDEIQKVIMQH